jgi:hypothetical protein
MPKSSVFELEMDIEKLHKSPIIYHILFEMMKTWKRKYRCQIYKLITSIRKKEQLPEEWEE